MRKKIIIDAIILMIISALFHGIYETWPNLFTALFFPVNESIWEHGKLILYSFLVLYPIDKLLYKDNLPSFSSNVVASIICIILTYAIFTPIFIYILKTNDNIIITLSIYMLCIILSLIIREKYINHIFKNDYHVGLIIFITASSIFGILTYNPRKNPLFYDYKDGIYGVNNNP